MSPVRVALDKSPTASSCWNCWSWSPAGLSFPTCRRSSPRHDRTSGRALHAVAHGEPRGARHGTGTRWAAQIAGHRGGRGRFRKHF